MALGGETAMKFAILGRWSAPLLPGILLGTGQAGAGEEPALAARAQAILKANCYRCHGQEGAVEGGMNYVLDRDKLLARRKVVPGHADKSPLYRRIVAGRMPPRGESPRPSP